MKYFFALLMFAGYLSHAQSGDSVRVKAFTTIIASPRVHLVLVEGPVPQVRIVCHGVPRSKVNIRQNGNTLRIFLDHARVLEKQVRYSAHGAKRPIYDGGSVTAYVTYQHLNRVQMRGSESLTATSTIHGEKFKLKLYGVTKVDINGLDVDKFKASLFGENRLSIRGGHANVQVYRLFGDNAIDTRSLESTVATTRIYGEGKVSIATRDALHIHAFGEPQIRVSGMPLITRGIILGRLDIRNE
ncbi:MAG TPA: DUF2807 domain-containing protein [Cyclobacteriaceae bacterium]|nr:DUF2807 domain-containing protein [Cyclobacteriaceae bacterium]